MEQQRQGREGGATVWTRTHTRARTQKNTSPPPKTKNTHPIIHPTPQKSNRHPQGYLALARLLGELYNYRLVPHALVFEALHLLVDYGHEVPPHLKVNGWGVVLVYVYIYTE